MLVSVKTRDWVSSSMTLSMARNKREGQNLGDSLVRCNASHARGGQAVTYANECGDLRVEATWSASSQRVPPGQLIKTQYTLPYRSIHHLPSLVRRTGTSRPGIGTGASNSIQHNPQPYRFFRQVWTATTTKIGIGRRGQVGASIQIR